ncbi:hypothetical protein BaRGS_00037946 [Batillaria attramentaria]|uniref:Uncharacterized protein n=1 Tax=Batillaria attramentaria TaxID=370345 RepID=A0ABD0J7B0_9CAEN
MKQKTKRSATVVAAGGAHRKTVEMLRKEGKEAERLGRERGERGKGEEEPGVTGEGGVGRWGGSVWRKSNRRRRARNRTVRDRGTGHAPGNRIKAGGKITRFLPEGKLDIATVQRTTHKTNAPVHLETDGVSFQSSLD